MEFDSFLTARGKDIFEKIREINKSRNLTGTIDDMFAAMLANSIDLYWRMVEYCSKHGYTQSPKEGGWEQIRPEYTIMRQEFSSVMKNLEKWGLSPAQRAEVMALKDKKSKRFNLTVSRDDIKRGYNLSGRLERPEDN